MNKVVRLAYIYGDELNLGENKAEEKILNAGKDESDSEETSILSHARIMYI